MLELILCQKFRDFGEKKKSYKIQIRENVESKKIFCIKLQQLGTGQKAEIRYKEDNTL